MATADKAETVEKVLRTGNLNSFFAEVLDARRDQIEAAVHAVLNPQEKVAVVVECPRCKAAANGRNMKSIKMELPVPKYNISELTKLLKIALEYGVARPAEEKVVTVSSTKTLAELRKLTDAELAEILAAG
jgi:hypothetical protein